MNYKEYSPTVLLEQYIDTYWVSGSSDYATESRILPDGYVDLIFDIDKDSYTFWDNSIRVSGMMTTYRNVVSKENSETFGIRFKTGQFNAISNIPLSEIKNKTINASDIIPKCDNFIYEELISKKNHRDKLQFIEEFLMKLINCSNSNKNSLVLSVCSSISSNFQSIDLVKIAQNHFISLRQLERRFKATVGVTMKEYHSIVRFSKTVESISNNPTKSLLNTAFDNGYFDHSHLTKEINRMAGINPSEF
ncbi:AraC family transcriptional regulator [Flavivirga spongiicola]|uniref:Helix-turn-helix domain-containing protein n=1 Tax=Flavivirga spongiicola TaxID=421621 RepID=A0ABU7XV78_9FLAO|nr:helix-turn-helix domain-containing protein [Flavivirga sp. MEBiC05379]MDO5979335.1 helix-turn-helix domain-containing protein [Flavivirga sp. MEBiC05379]